MNSNQLPARFVQVVPYSIGDVYRRIQRSCANPPVVKFFKGKGCNVEGTDIEICSIELPSGVVVKLDLEGKTSPGEMTETEQNNYGRNVWKELIRSMDTDGMKVLQASMIFYLASKECEKGLDYFYVTLNDYCKIMGFKEHIHGGYKTRVKDRIRYHIRTLARTKVSADIHIREGGRGRVRQMEETLLSNPQIITGGKSAVYKLSIGDAIKAELAKGQYAWMQIEGLQLPCGPYGLYYWMCDLFRIRGGTKVRKQTSPQIVDRWTRISFSALIDSIKGGFKFDRGHPSRSINTLHTHLDSLVNHNPPLLDGWTIRDKADVELPHNWHNRIKWSEPTDRPLKDIIYWFQATKHLIDKLELKPIELTPPIIADCGVVEEDENESTLRSGI